MGWRLVGTDSFLSGYPEPRDIFIQSQWRLSEDGTFIEKVADTQGVYVSCGDVDVVEWLDPPAVEQAPADQEAARS